MRFFFVLILSLFFITSKAQKQISLEEAKDHIGDSVKIEGVIYGVKVFTDDDKNPTLSLLSLGADYPNQTLTVAVYPSYKTATIVFPDERFKGEKAIVIGKIELYKGHPQIAVRTAGQLAIAAAHAIAIPKQ